ncbi:hypothetical protein [Streptomyces sp. NPDC058335]|uniref:hypothetical protein n=1 Tax=Streptomyces sp. NPDC058335 TaxID=3346451 RepID=UPI00366337DA
MKLARNHNRTRLGVAAGLVALSATVLGAAGASAAGTAAPQSRQIGSSVLGSDYRITLTALRSADDQYAASVRLQVHTQTGGAWKETDRVTVGDVDGWFWYPLTGSGAVCEFSTASTEPAPLTVSLLLTPSLGCSDPTHYVVKEGRVFAG